MLNIKNKSDNIAFEANYYTNIFTSIYIISVNMNVLPFAKNI